MPPLVTKQSNKPAPPKTGSVLDRISGISFADDLPIKMLLYGMSGSGKTTLWGTFPGPILAILCSGGATTGELLSLNTPANRRKIQQVVLQKSIEVREIAAHVAKTGVFKTIVLDHASGYQDMVMAEVGCLKEIPASMTWGTYTREQYGQGTVQVKENLRTFLDLPVNIVFVAQQRSFKEDDSDLAMPWVGAGLTPALAGWFNVVCDYVCQTFKRPLTVIETTRIGNKDVPMPKRTDKTEYCLRTDAAEVYQTKFRVPRGFKLPQVIPDPSYDKIKALLNGVNNAGPE